MKQVKFLRPTTELIEVIAADMRQADVDEPAPYGCENELFHKFHLERMS